MSTYYVRFEIDRFGSANPIGVNLETHANRRIEASQVNAMYELEPGTSVDIGFTYGSILREWARILPPQLWFKSAVAVQNILMLTPIWQLSRFYRKCHSMFASLNLCEPYQPFVLDAVREYFTALQGQDIARVEISAAEYMPVLSLCQQWNCIELSSHALAGPVWTGTCITYNLVIKRLSGHTPETIATIERIHATCISLDDTVPSSGCSNLHVTDALIESPQIEFACRFPRLRRLRMYAAEKAVPIIDCTHCPRVTYFDTHVETVSGYIAVVQAIPTLAIPPRSRKIDSIERTRILAEHAPLLLDCYKWHPRKNGGFSFTQRLFHRFFMGIDRLVDAGDIAYPDPAAVERVLFHYEIDTSLEACHYGTSHD